MSSAPILILDDDRNIGICLSIGLELHNYKTKLVSSLESAIAALEKEKPLLLVTDFWLSEGKNSKAVVDRVHSKYGKGSVPVILMSATDDLPLLMRNLSADLYLSKPFDLEDALSSISSLLRGLGNESADCA